MTSKLLTAGSLAPIDEVLTWLIQSTVLLAVGLLAGRLLRRRGPAEQSTLYRTILVTVFLSPVASMAIAAMGFPGLVIRLPTAAADVETKVTHDGRDRVGPIARHGSSPIPILFDRMPIAPSGVEPTSVMNQLGLRDGGSTTAEPPSILKTGTTPDPAQSPTAPGWIARVRSIILASWLLGTAILAMRLLVGHRRMVRLRKTAIFAEPEAQALCHELAGRMRLRPPQVLRSPFLSSPCVDGLLRPAILLPEDAEQHLRDTFVHELAHLGRRDGLWNLIRQLATAALWVQPLLWVLSRRIEQTAEEVCDDFVVAFGADRGRYAGHLLELAGRRLPPLAPTGVGMISLRPLLARRIARILDSTRSLSTRAGRRTLTATLLASLAGTILTGLLDVGDGSRNLIADEPKPGKPATAGDPQPAPADPVKPASRMTVKGRVVDQEGRPVAGATVASARYRRGGIGPYGRDADRQEIDRVVTDLDGRFRLTIIDSQSASDPNPDDPDRWGRPAIVAWAPGFGPAWPKTLAREVTEDQPIKLVRDDVPITGRVVDLEGRPVAGALIRVDSLWTADSAAAIDQWLKAVATKPISGERPRSHYFPIGGKMAGVEAPVAAARATADADGRFHMTGLGRDRLAILDITGPGIAARRIQVVTRRMPNVQGRPLDEPGLQDATYHGASPTIVAEPGRPIEGEVRDADTKAPIPSAIVTAMQRSGSRMNIEGLITAMTDAEGRYRLIGLPKGDAHVLSVYPPVDQPYFVTDFLKVPAGPGIEPVRFDIALHRGVWIDGRVRDAKTGQPVRAVIHYYPYLANMHAKTFLNFRANSMFANWTGDRYRTDDQGRFRVVGIPGSGVVAVKSFARSYQLGLGSDRLSQRPARQSMRRDGLPTYNQISPQDFEAVAEVNVPANGVGMHRDFALEPSLSLTIQLVDPDAKPLMNVTAFGRFSDHKLGDHLYDKSQAEIFGLDPAKAKTVLFLHRDRKLGAVLTIRASEPASASQPKVTLRPCATVTGRIVDAEGKPVAGGIWVRLDAEGYADRARVYSSTEPVGEDGRFRIDNLAPGGTYTLQARDQMALGLSARGKMEPPQFKPFELARNLKAEPGQVIDLGTLSAATGHPVKTSELPAALKHDQGKVPTRDVPITGRIIDLEGRPIRGVTIQVDSTSTAKGGDLTPWLEAVRRGEPPWVAYRHIENDETEKPSEKAETDAQGRFRIEGLGAEKVVRLSIEGPTVAYTNLNVVTRRIEPLPARGFTNFFGPGTETVYGADLTFTASPGRVVEGVVRDEKTKQVMKDVEVRSLSFAGSNSGGIKNLNKTRTDAQGRFHLAGLPKGSGNELLIVPNDDQPYFMRDVAVPDPPGIGAIPIEIDLHKGIWIEGKLTDKETGSPVAGAWLHYLPFLENPFARVTPEFRGGGYTAGSCYQDRYPSKADGSYRLVGLPGRAIVGAVVYKGKPYRRGAGAESIKGMDKHGHFPTCSNPVIATRYFPTSMKEIDPAEDTEAVHLDIALDPGAKVRLRVVDPQGKPVTGAKTGGRRDRGHYGEEAETQAEFDVVTLGPGEDRMVWLVHEGRKLGRVIHVKEGDDKNGPVVVTLEPSATITGRIVDANDNPVAGATIGLWLKPGGDFPLSLPEVAAGKDGRFTVPDVPTGCEYSVVAKSVINQQRFAVKHAAVRPGETTDVGDIRLKD